MTGLPIFLACVFVALVVLLLGWAVYTWAQKAPVAEDPDGVWDVYTLETPGSRELTYQGTFNTYEEAEVVEDRLIKDGKVTYMEYVTPASMFG